MRLYQQLILFMLAAMVLPLSGVGFWLLRESERELVRRIGEQQRAVASGTAEAAAAKLLEAINGVERSAALIDWERASDEERQGALKLLYQQSPAISAVALRGAQGQLLGSPVFSAQPLNEHLGFDVAGTTLWLQALDVGRLKGGPRGQVVMGAAFHPLGSDVAALPLAVKLTESENALFAFAEVSLAPVQALLRARESSGVGHLDVVDGQGRVAASSDASRVLQTLEAPAREGMKQSGALPGTQTFSTASQWVSAAPFPDELGLWAVVSVDEATALSPVRRMRHTIFLSLGASLVVLLGFGFLFARRINARLSEVMRGADAYGRGDLALRLTVGGTDELAELATAFNRMGGELESARGRLLRWNDELTARVDEATADLRAAQAQLVEAQKLAAVGQLGAGVAHEINNPLAGILGHTQLLLLERTERDPDFAALRKIEQSAKRCKEITQNLLRFSEQRAEPEMRPVDLNAIVRDALSLVEARLLGDGIRLETRLDDAHLMVRGDPGHLSQVVLALIANAQTAMLKSERKVLSVATRTDGENRVLTVADTGKGIAPENIGRLYEPFFTTKDVWSNVGLGLSVAYRVLSEHRGRIEVVSTPGEGAVFTVTLPDPESPSTGVTHA